MPILLKNPHQILAMREAGRVTATALAEMREAIKPGVSTYELDQIAAKVFEKFGARAAFLGYPPGGRHPFPATITACINEELVHGIPSKDRILQEGDIISLDTACHYKGFVGDSAFTAGVGEVSDEAQKLMDVTEESLYVGIRASIAGNSTQDIATAIQTYVEGHGFSLAKDYSGHGVGEAMHEEPSIPNWWPNRKEMRRLRNRWKSYPLKMGMTFALEPMVSAGKPDTKELDDHWTVIMKDRSLSAHFEHTIAVVDNEAIILTLLED